MRRSSRLWMRMLPACMHRLSTAAWRHHHVNQLAPTHSNSAAGLHGTTLARHAPVHLCIEDHDPPENTSAVAVDRATSHRRHRPIHPRSASHEHGAKDRGPLVAAHVDTSTIANASLPCRPRGPLAARRKLSPISPIRCSQWPAHLPGHHLVASSVHRSTPPVAGWCGGAGLVAIPNVADACRPMSARCTPAHHATCSSILSAPCSRQESPGSSGRSGRRSSSQHGWNARPEAPFPGGWISSDGRSCHPRAAHASPMEQSQISKSKILKVLVPDLWAIFIPPFPWNRQTPCAMTDRWGVGACARGPGSRCILDFLPRPTPLRVRSCLASPNNIS